MKKHEDGHCESIAHCVDDVMIFSKDPMSIMKKLQDAFTMKGVGAPQCYLGGDVKALDMQWAKEGLFIGSWFGFGPVKFSDVGKNC